MKTFYKYTICFLLGIIVYYLIFAENIIEGNVFEKESSQLNRGCSKYTCKNDPSTYDNYQKKIYSTLSDAPQEYNNCLPISEQEIYHSRGTDSEHQPLSDSEVTLCTNEICCENFICSENAENITCPDGQIFLPNNKCDVNISVEEACTEARCCSELTSGNSQYRYCGPISDDLPPVFKSVCYAAGEDDSQGTRAGSNCHMISVNPLEELFDNIIEFRDDHGGKNNGQFITGEDILFYFYYKFLDIKKMSEVLSPLDLNGERFPNTDDTDDIEALKDNINTILKGDNGGDNNITTMYNDNEYKGKPVFFNDDVKLQLDFDDNCTYDITTRSKIVNNKDNYFPEECIGYNNKKERYAFYKNIISYDNSVFILLRHSNNTLNRMANHIKTFPLDFRESIGSGLFTGNTGSLCADIDINYPLLGATLTDHAGYNYNIPVDGTDGKSITLNEDDDISDAVQDEGQDTYTIKGIQKITYEDTPNENKVLEIYDTYKTLKSNANITYPEYRLFNKWLNKININDEMEINKKIVLNKVLTLESIFPYEISVNTPLTINQKTYYASIKNKPGNKIILSGLPDTIGSRSLLQYSRGTGQNAINININIISVNYGDISSELNNIITSNSEYNEGDDELNLKKLILNLDRNTSYHNLKPLDKLFHTYLGSSKNTLISKEMFIALNN